MFQFPDVVCPNGHKTTPDMNLDQSKQKCTTCGKAFVVTAYGETLDVDMFGDLLKELGLE